MTQQLAAADQRIAGVAIGIVTDVNDPDEIGRVKVTLPWYGSGYAQWARVAQPYAGPGYGWTWVPEKDTEVLIAFAHGDMRWPYVVGALYGHVDRPPDPRTATSDIRTLRTPAGSELSFDETRGEIEVKTPTGASIRLDEQSGAITIEAVSTISLKAAEISIEGTARVTVKGGQIALN